MLTVAEDNARLLLGGISRGEVVLYLGAGASATCLSRQGTPVLQGKALAGHIAELSGLSYANEELPEVLNAVLGPRMSVEPPNCPPSWDILGDDCIVGTLMTR